MSITLTADTAERIRELLSNTHDAALSDSDDDLASEIDTLCGALLGGEDASAEHPRVVIDITGGVVQQIIADRPVSVVLLDGDKDEVEHALTDSDDANLAPSFEQRHAPLPEKLRNPWAMREASVEINPEVAGYYTRFASIPGTREAFAKAARENLS